MEICSSIYWQPNIAFFGKKNEVELFTTMFLNGLKYPKDRGATLLIFRSSVGILLHNDTNMLQNISFFKNNSQV